MINSFWHGNTLYLARCLNWEENPTRKTISLVAVIWEQGDLDNLSLDSGESKISSIKMVKDGWGAWLAAKTVKTPVKWIPISLKQPHTLGGRGGGGGGLHISSSKLPKL